MIKIGEVLSDESLKDSKTVLFHKKPIHLNFNFNNVIKDDPSVIWTRFFLENRIKLTIIDDSLFLDLNWSRQLFLPRIVNLFNELFCNFDEAKSRHPSIVEEPVLEERELTPEETIKLLSRFNDNNENQLTDIDVQHPDLYPELRPYQESAVRWLLNREQSRGNFIDEYYETLHARHLDNKEFYLNVSSLNIFSDDPPKCFLPPGGILADEMGLGKTVEMLALFLLHPNPCPINTSPELFTDDLPLKRRKVVRCICGSQKSRKLIECLNCGTFSHRHCVGRKSFPKTLENYICPECWELQENLLDCKTTLIVSPHSIKNQWRSEIEGHIAKPLKILMYERITNKKYISPMDLIEYDIVITDYSTLRQEVYYDADNSCQMSRRNESKTMRLLSPLTKIRWWRICMDEAQMVSSTMTKVYQMINKLDCVNKWAVTGTPIHKSINDLLVHVNLFDLTCLAGNTFKRLVYEYRTGINDTLVKHLQKIMWRTSKDQVQEQLNIPENKEVTHFVNFSNIMTFFYDEQRQKYTDQFFREANFVKSVRVKDIDRSRVIKLVTPLKLLRQSCTCPVILNSSVKNKEATKTNLVEPKDLSKHLISTNEIACKIQLRAVVSSYNGLAGLYFLKNQYSEAIKIYKYVLNLAKQYSEKISVDSLLQIHAIHNMIEAYSVSGIEEDLSGFKDQLRTIVLKYLKEKSELAVAARLNYKETKSEILKMSTVNSRDLRKSVSECFDWIESDNIVFLTKVNEELSNPVLQNQRNKKYEGIHSIQGVLYVVTGWLDRLEAERVKMVNVISKMEDIEITDAIIEEKKARIELFSQTVFNCHLDAKRDKRKKPKKCLLCKATEIFEEYEKVLYNSMFPLGTHMPSLEEGLLKLTIAHIKSTQIPKEEMRNSEKCLERIALYKKELADANKFWIELDFSVKAYDELNMCKLRLQIIEKANGHLDDDEEVDVTAIYEVGRYEVDDRLEQQKTELEMENKELTKKLGRLKYVKHIENTTNPGSCPICMTDPDEKYTFLLCGHHICLTCFRRFETFKKKTLQCAICREETRFDEVYFVACKQTCDPQEEAICGKFTPKIEKIIQTILKITKADSTSKILIFSEWESILGVLATALSLNSISHRFKCTPDNLKCFKNPSLNVTCLLMTVDQGSKGLNLTEANHVIFVEPLLNRGDKLQAIGRVHRMGQKRPTTIHHFIVHDTIEEKIYHMTKDNEFAQFKDMSIDDLKQLFSLDS